MDERPLSNPLDFGIDPDAPDFRPGGSDGPDIFISLYLILLAFFVVLNSISNQEQVRAQAAVASVNTSFKKMHRAKSTTIDLAARARLDAPSDQFYSEIQGLLSGMIDFPGKYPSRGGNILRVEVPADVLFIRHQARMRYDQADFMDHLADLLIKSSADGERMLEIRIGTGGALPRDKKMWKNIHVRRAVVFARELQKRGVPSRVISTGLLASDKEMVWMTFLSRRHRQDQRPLSGYSDGNGGQS